MVMFWFSVKNTFCLANWNLFYRKRFKIAITGRNIFSSKCTTSSLVSGLAGVASLQRPRPSSLIKGWASREAGDGRLKWRDGVGEE